MSRSVHGPPSDDPRGSRAGGRSLSDPPSPRLGSRRRIVLQCLRQSPEALGVAEVAALTRLHPNTARFHLDALSADALATRTIETRLTRGRPRVLYAARTEAMGQRSYGLLAEMLADMAAASGDVPKKAVATGHSWGRTIVQRPSPRGATGADRAITNDRAAEAGRAVHTLQQVFADIGFQPELSTVGATTTLMLRHCPFREVATRYPTVVCGVHLGMMQGVLAELGGAVVAESLDPLVTPRLCVARVHTASTP